MENALYHPDGTGLQKTPHDPHDFPLGGMFGEASIGSLPRSFTVSEPLVIKDQGYGTDCCTGEALTAVAEDEDGMIFDPLYTFARTKQLAGDPSGAEWGADLRTACKSAVKFGFYPMSETAASMRIAPEDRDRALLSGYDKSFDEHADEYRKQTFFTISGQLDTFDQMKSGLWQTREFKRSVFTGVNWNPLWTEAENGVVESMQEGRTFGHAVKAFGWDLEDYLVLQLSNGKNIGKQGIFTLHRDVVNSSFQYGGFTLMDIPRAEAEYQLNKIGFFNYWFKSIFS